MEAFAEALDAIKLVDPVPSEHETIGAVIARAPADSEIHRRMARLWECKNCWRRGTLSELFLCVEGDSEAACPRCGGDRIVMLQEPKGRQ